MTQQSVTAPPADIARRPDVGPDVMAVLTAAVEQAWPRPRPVVVEESGIAPAWRFSGRWWTRPATSRRDRPMVSR